MPQGPADLPPVSSQQVRGREDERTRRFADIVKSPQRKVRAKPDHHAPESALFSVPRLSDKENGVVSPSAFPTALSPVRANGGNTALQARSLNSLVEQPAFAPSAEKPVPAPKGKGKATRVVKKMPTKKVTRSASKAKKIVREPEPERQPELGPVLEPEPVLDSTHEPAAEAQPALEPQSEPVKPNRLPQEPASQADYPQAPKPEQEPEPEPQREFETPVEGFARQSEHQVPRLVPTPKESEAPPPLELVAASAEEPGRPSCEISLDDESADPLGSPPKRDYFGLSPDRASSDHQNGDSDAPASVARPVDESEKTALPKSVPEHMDVDASTEIVSPRKVSQAASQDAVVKRTSSGAHKSFITAGSESREAKRPRMSEEQDELDDEEYGGEAEDEDEVSAKKREALTAKMEPDAAAVPSDESSDLSDPDSQRDTHTEDVPPPKRSLFATAKGSTVEADMGPGENTISRNPSKSFYQLLLSAASNDEPDADVKDVTAVLPANNGKKRKSDEMETDDDSNKELKEAFRPTKKTTMEHGQGQLGQGTVGLGLTAQQPTSAVAALRSRLGAAGARVGHALAHPAEFESVVTSPRSPHSPAAQSPVQRPITGSPASTRTDSNLPPPSPIMLGEPAKIETALKPAPMSPSSNAPSKLPAASTTPKKASVGSQASSIRSFISSHSQASKPASGLTPTKSKMSTLLPTPSNRALRGKAAPVPAQSTTPQTSPKRLPFSRLPLANTSPKQRPATPSRQDSQQGTPQGSPTWSIGSKLKGFFSFAGAQHNAHATSAQTRSPKLQGSEQLPKTASVQSTPAQSTRLATVARAEAARKAAESEKTTVAPKAMERAPSATGIRPPGSAAGKKPVQPPGSTRTKAPASAAKPAVARSAAAKPAPTPAAKPAPTPAAKAPAPSTKPTPASASKPPVPKPTHTKAAPAPRPPPKTTVMAKPLPPNPKSAGAAFRPQGNGRIASANTSHLSKKPSLLMKPQAARPVGSIVPVPPPVAPSGSANFSQHNPFQQAKAAPKPVPPVTHARTPDGGSPDSTRDEDIELPEVRSEYSMSDDEETIKRRQLAPDWCKGQTLQDTLEAQMDIDTDALFGVPEGNVPIEEIFPKSNNARRRPRSSSANWAGDDGLKAWEIERYNRRMGIQNGFLGAGTNAGPCTGQGR